MDVNWLVKRIERSIHEAEHAEGMRTGLPSIKLDTSHARHLLAALAASEAAREAAEQEREEWRRFAQPWLDAKGVYHRHDGVDFPSSDACPYCQIQAVVDERDNERMWRECLDARIEKVGDVVRRWLDWWQSTPVSYSEVMRIEEILRGEHDHDPN